ncbi:6244_t:CDS:2 [Diversispora eburnea]|uniref:Phospho-2-dehydro-3-deoxyheptonate aldolase n=1 Tax=Diversispora eburnea TaxID=1213867 RepID=A0A9N8ZKP3_9GLOM|nr:6244_t:CDS:2 [Diversispora eburnea]
MGIKFSKTLKKSKSSPSTNMQEDPDFRYINGRRYHNVESVKYPLPNDDEELDRLHQQHFLLRYIWQRNFAAPVKHVLNQNGSKVLDVGFLFSAIPKDSWPNVINELTRVLKPGGYLELVEINPIPLQTGSVSTRLFIAQSLENVIEEKNRLPYGSETGKLGQAAVENSRIVLSHMKPFFLENMKISSEEFDNNMDILVKELLVCMAYILRRIRSDFKEIFSPETDCEVSTIISLEQARLADRTGRVKIQSTSSDELGAHLGARIPVVRIAQLSSQYAKPRSNPFEGQDIPSFRGDNVNGSDLDDRKPDPERLVRSSFLRMVTSSVCDRTRQLNSAHVEHIRGIQNPIEINVGPSMQPYELKELLEKYLPYSKQLRNQVIW